jgi:para-nitrobenzyl esterase
VKDPESYNWLSAYLSDRWKALAVDEVAEVISASGIDEPVFAYRFDWDEGASNWLVDLPLLLGSPHAVELDFIWGPILGQFVTGLYTEENAPGREFLTQAMRGYWGQFAHTGDPGTGSGGDLTSWRPWQTEEGAFLLIDTPADGGLRMTTEGVRAADLKDRLRRDDRLAEPSTRCAMYVTLFLDNGGVEDYFNTREYQELDCAEFPPWSLAERTR